VWELLSAQLHDAVSAWELQPDGSYIERQPEAGPVSMSSQQLLMKLYRDRARQAAILGRG
jgi:polyphosphate kinase